MSAPELADIIRENRKPWVTNTEHREMEARQAEAILAAGYSKPRTIPNEHLSCDRSGKYPVDFPEGLIVESADGTAWRFDEGDWGGIGWGNASLRGPATVLYTPKES